MRAMLKAQINKTDRNNARGIAHMMRVGLYRPAHVKTLRSQKLRMLLTHRKLLQSKAIALENDLRSTLRNFGLKVGMVGNMKYRQAAKRTAANIEGHSEAAKFGRPRRLSLYSAATRRGSGQAAESGMRVRTRRKRSCRLRRGSRPQSLEIPARHSFLER